MHGGTRRPEDDSNLWVYLGDSAAYKTWSAVSGRLPTYRRSSGLLWSPHYRRWLTGREKLASLGFPVTPAVAMAMGAPMLGVKDTKRAALVAGNAMALSTVGVVELVALCCYRRLS